MIQYAFLVVNCRKISYNVGLGGEGSESFSEETKIKLSKVLKGRHRKRTSVEATVKTRKLKDNYSKYPYWLWRNMRGENNPMFGKSSWPDDPQKYETRRLKMIQSLKSLKWWNNGTKMTRSKECPGPEWQRGRIKKKNSGN